LEEAEVFCAAFFKKSGFFLDRRRSMDFEDTPDQAEFRAEVRAWLTENVEPRPPGAALTDAQRLERARRFLAKKGAAGYSRITLPKEYGGLGGTEIQHVIFQQEQLKFDVETMHGGSDFFAVGLELCCTTILKCGTEEQRRRFLPRLLRGEEIWCQLFSEPSGGSDLAGVRTRAVREGDAWRITGQKVWTSGGHYADLGICLARTDPSVPKHRGLTMFAVDMKDPGVRVQPIRQISGDADFNEVFLDNVLVQDDFRLGAVNDGWKVALTTLGQERSTAASLNFIAPEQLLSLAQATELGGRPAIEDGRVREKIAECWINTFGARLMSYRSQTELTQGAVPGPEESWAKLVLTAQGQRSATVAMDILGVAGSLTAEERGDQRGEIEGAWYWAPCFRIAGGADEILRNILAERVLGLPGDIRVDRDIPFNQIKA
jgi:alkylation response protein AidB-like acyl-CoA dehydrogenase